MAGQDEIACGLLVHLVRLERLLRLLRRLHAQIRQFHASRSSGIEYGACQAKLSKKRAKKPRQKDALIQAAQASAQTRHTMRRTACHAVFWHILRRAPPAATGGRTAYRIYRRAHARRWANQPTFRFGVVI